MNQMWARPQTDMTPVSDPLTSSPNAPNMPVASIKGETGENADSVSKKETQSFTCFHFST